ncbi:MAG: hypothetical protein COU51_01985 [Parcubacteria group bacterium CG10_big_fil_rev_8_21_14_0_10_36_14]|nr:MAG: hypothetical protein COU51_01985 [Parcubacteria group bacterium CG10_big_fil_rev_8_21_14_0_10_36_14]
MKTIAPFSLKDFELTQDYIPDPLVIYNLKTGISIRVNKEACKFTEFSREELEGKPILKLPILLKSDLALISEKIKMRAQKKAVFPYGIKIKTKSGKILFVEINGTIVKDGADYLVLIFFRDVTKKIMLEHALIREKEKFEKYINIADVMILSLDTKGNITFLNYRGYDLLGCKNAESCYKDKKLIGKNWFNNFLPKRITGEVNIVFDLLMKGKTKQTAHYENAILRLDGKEKMILWCNTVLKDAEGKITGTLGSGMDITKQKEDESALEEKINQLKKMNELMIGRELRMVELKEKLKK